MSRLGNIPIVDPVAPTAVQGIGQISDNLNQNANRNLQSNLAAAQLQAQADLQTAEIKAKEKLAQAELKSRKEITQMETDRYAEYQQFQAKESAEGREFAEMEAEKNRQFEMMTRQQQQLWEASRQQFELTKMQEMDEKMRNGILAGLEASEPLFAESEMLQDQVTELNMLSELSTSLAGKSASEIVNTLVKAKSLLDDQVNAATASATEFKNKFNEVRTTYWQNVNLSRDEFNKSTGSKVADWADWSIARSVSGLFHSPGELASLDFDPKEGAKYTVEKFVSQMAGEGFLKRDQADAVNALFQTALARQEAIKGGRDPEVGPTSKAELTKRLNEAVNAGLDPVAFWSMVEEIDSMAKTLSQANSKQALQKVIGDNPDLGFLDNLHASELVAQARVWSGVDMIRETMLEAGLKRSVPGLTELQKQQAWLAGMIERAQGNPLGALELDQNEFAARLPGQAGTIGSLMGRGRQEREKATQYMTQAQKAERTRQKLKNTIPNQAARAQYERLNAK